MCAHVSSHTAFVLMDFQSPPSPSVSVGETRCVRTPSKLNCALATVGGHHTIVTGV